MIRKKQFVLQFRLPAGPTAADLDWLVQVESALDGALRRQCIGTADGHDIGSGAMNIFFCVKSYSGGEQFLKLYLKYQDWANDAVIAKRLKDESYEVVWPKDYDGAFELCAS